MKPADLQKQPKKKVELIFSAILYEIIGSILASISLKIMSDYDAVDTFFLSIMLSFIALFWNMIFNHLFDRYLIKKRGNIIKSTRDRILHGIGFEAIFSIIALVFIMVYKQISIVDAFFMEVFFLIFFLVYTIVYTYIYDVVRGLFLARTQRKRITIIDVKKIE
ncbi:PACE efflux transporter [Orbus sturtevantii]|uniref:PACE efflux transporter n=1 Tax=Orbus sturtevantii TaxID=3074109 RepID=UPI00370D448D